MLLECLIKRVGPTVVTLENTKYDFMPIPGTKYHDVKHRNLVTVINAAGQQVKEWVEEIRSEPAEESTSVCDVGKEQHVSHLLASGQYRPYNQDRAIKEADERRKKNAINLFEGYKFEKYFDLGYIIVKKDSTHPYVGSDGVWRKEHSGSYFKTEIEAYGFLTEEIEVARERKSKAK
jgi:hypothetical protein